MSGSAPRRGLAVFVTVLLFAASVPFAQAQDDMIRTQTRLADAAAERLQRMDEVDAGSIIGMLNEGLFALECASPKKMRAIIMFISASEVVRIESDVVEMEPGNHSAEGVMPGASVGDAWQELTRGEPLRHLRTYEVDKPFESEGHIVDAVRDKMGQSGKKDGAPATLSLVMFLAPADADPERLSTESVRVAPMGIIFGEGR